MGGNNEDCDDKYNNDTGDGNCDDGGEGRGQHPPPNDDIVIA